MSELKTQANDADPAAFIASVEHPGRRADGEVLLKLFGDITGKKPVMWGDSIVGYGEYSYTRSDGNTYSWMKTGFSPRKQNLSLYIMGGVSAQQSLLDKLGKHKTGKACLYINKLADVDMDVLSQLIKADFESSFSGGCGC